MIKSIRAGLRLASTPQGLMAWTAFGVRSPRMIFSQRLAVIALFLGLALAQTSAVAAGENLFNVADLDQPPIARVQADPAYPYEMARAGISGWTIVAFVVNANGDVQSIRPIKSTHRNFEEAACKAILKWKFKPGIKNGQPVNTRISLKFDYNMIGNRESVVKTPYSVKEASETRTLRQQGEKESAHAPPAPDKPARSWGLGLRPQRAP